MCTYHYLHHHHIPPCPKDLYFVIHYLFCPDATIDLNTGNRQPCNNATYDDSHLAASDMSSSMMSNSMSTMSTSPTSSQSSASTTSYYSNDGTSFPVDYNSLYSSTASMSLSQQQQSQTMDFNNPCTSSTCLTSLECSSGQCRLEELGGRWTCCRCGGKGNEYAWCKARPGLVRGADPDMVCYHVVCGGCRATGSSSGKGKGKR